MRVTGAGRPESGLHAFGRIGGGTMSRLPMSAEQFFDVFRAYNEAFWPAPLAWSLAALVVVWVVIRAGQSATEAAGLFLAAVWAWAGVAYHLLFLAPRNPAAWAFGAIFVLQAGIFLRGAFIRRDIVFQPRLDAYGVAGAVMIGWALIAYPLIALGLGHAYPRLPTFGVPCPTSIFTFGMLLWTVGRLPPHFLVVPLLWSLVAIGAAVNWGALEDIAMPIAAFTASAMLLLRNRKSVPTQRLSGFRPAADDRPAGAGFGQPAR